jgi:hypothetical protein
MFLLSKFTRWFHLLKNNERIANKAETRCIFEEPPVGLVAVIHSPMNKFTCVNTSAARLCLSDLEYQRKPLVRQHYLKRLTE